MNFYNIKISFTKCTLSNRGNNLAPHFLSVILSKTSTLKKINYYFVSVCVTMILTQGPLTSVFRAFNRVSQSSSANGVGSGVT